MHHGEKFYAAVVGGQHKEIKIEFVKHARNQGSKEFDVLLKITAEVLAFNLLQSECKGTMVKTQTTNMSSLHTNTNMSSLPKICRKSKFFDGSCSV